MNQSEVVLRSGKLIEKAMKKICICVFTKTRVVFLLLMYLSYVRGPYYLYSKAPSGYTFLI